ncbi:MAG: tetratricopeptide repeat protein [Nitrospirales bacterium]|nr:tetratricopeptide repeat protein [Nitrospirales bacterium]
MNQTMTNLSAMSQTHSYTWHTFIMVLLVIISQLTLANPGLAEHPSTSSVTQPCNNTSPVTNACVEAGLRQQREALRKLSEYQSNTPETHVQLAEKLMHQGDPNGAIEEYQAAITLNHEMAEAFRGMGAVYLDKHEWPLAEDALRRSSQLEPEDERTWFWLGRALLAQRKFSGAIEALTNAIMQDNQDSETFSDLALAHMAQGHSGEAEEALRQAIQLKPDFSEAHHRLEIVQSARQKSERLIQSSQEILEIYFKRE